MSDTGQPTGSQPADGSQPRSAGRRGSQPASVDTRPDARALALKKGLSADEYTALEAETDALFTTRGQQPCWDVVRNLGGLAWQAETAGAPAGLLSARLLHRSELMS